MSLAGWTLVELGILFGAGAAAITTLYLLRMRRRQVVVPFAALWERVSRESESRQLWRKLRRLLSWLLQLVILALLCLVLGDPRPDVWLRDPFTLAIVVDQSASMAGPDAEDPDKTRLQAGLSRIRPELEAIGPTDRALVIGAGEEVGVLAALSGDTSALLAAIEGAEPSYGEADLARAIAMAQHAVGDEPGGRILVVTDGALDPGAMGALMRCTEGSTPCAIAPVTGSAANVAITAFAARRYPHDREHVEVLAEVRNLGDVTASVILSVDAEGVSVGRTPLTLEPGESKREVLTSLDAARSRLEARLLPGDDAEGVEVSADLGPAYDDVAYAVVPPLKPLDVALVTDGTNLFLEAALLTLGDHVRLTGVTPEEARTGSRALDDADVAIIDVGDEVWPTELPDAHLVLFDPWRLPESPSPIAKLGDVRRPFLTEQDRRHPIVKNIVLKDINIARGTSLVAEPGDQVLVRSLGVPLMVLREGEHHVLAVGFDPRQTDFPLRVAFPLLVDNILRYFEQQEAGFVASVPVGTNRELPLADLGVNPQGVTRVAVRGPGFEQGLEYPVERGRFRLRALVPGFYRVRSLDGAAGEVEVELAVNQASVDASDLHDRLEEAGLSGSRAGEPPEPAPLSQGPLWTTILLVVCGFIAVEWLSYHRRVTV